MKQKSSCNNRRIFKHLQAYTGINSVLSSDFVSEDRIIPFRHRKDAGGNVFGG
jgi:hypothetical protein